MKPQSAKAKGRRLQQRVASSILDSFPQLRPDDCFSTSMGAPGEDIRLSPAARALVPLSFECKNTERLNVWSALEQCTANAPSGAEACVVFSRNNCGTYAAVRWDFLLKLLCNRQTPRSEEDGREGDGLPPELQSLVDQISAFRSK